MADNRIAQYQKLCRALSRKLGQPATSELVRYAASLHLLRSSQQAAVISGKTVPISEIIGLAELLRPYDDDLPLPKVQVVDADGKPIKTMLDPRDPDETPPPPSSPPQGPADGASPPPVAAVPSSLPNNIVPFRRIEKTAELIERERLDHLHAQSVKFHSNTHLKPGQSAAVGGGGDYLGSVRGPTHFSWGGQKWPNPNRHGL